MHKRKSELRDQLRAQRRKIAASQRRSADFRICTTLRRIPSYQQATTIALYLQHDGEPSLSGLFDDSGKRFVVPVIRGTRMRFAWLRNMRHMHKNRFGIAEPVRQTYIPTSAIDVVLLPVVGFDSVGNRLGMGGGYYDRHFSYMLSRRLFFRPQLIGVAYEIQHVNQLPHEVWDVPLRGIVTERCYRKLSEETRL